MLCTAADVGLANEVASHVGGFSAVLASDGAHNLSGPNKAQALVACTVITVSTMSATLRSTQGVETRTFCDRG